ncbi:MAG TPA: CDP-alcohol phosphatidyltransferase family protein [Gemmatimonadaceae bacterium]|nr:CDP-alcohol phosphatidyltransferase family protein [Gemmatimonadaceae bacterium]
MTHARGAGAAVARQQMFNLPNTISAARILVSPLIALLPLLPSPFWRGMAFVLYVISAVSDYFDGWFARTRGLVTDLGKALDPLADKLLLVATFIPLIVLQAPRTDPVGTFIAGVLRISPSNAFIFPFTTWFGTFTLPWWVVALVLGRELVMTMFRQMAQMRGVVIAANAPAKLKAVMQYIWVGAAYFWFCAQSLAATDGWSGHAAWAWFSPIVGAIGVVTMWIAVTLTIVSFAIYLMQYRKLITS